MLFGHSDNAGVGPNHKHAKVRGVASHAKDSGLQVFFVASQVDERDDLRGLFTHSNPIKVAMLRTIDNIASRVKPEDVISYRRCPPRLSLVFVSEEPLPCQPSTIVKFSVGQNTKQGGFPCIDISNDCTSDLREVLK